MAQEWPHSVGAGLSYLRSRRKMLDRAIHRYEPVALLGNVLEVLEKIRALYPIHIPNTSTQPDPDVPHQNSREYRSAFRDLRMTPLPPLFATLGVSREC